MNLKDIANRWDVVANHYRDNNFRQPDYLSNYYHVQKNIGRIKNKSILEVGSGSGQISAYLAKKGAIVHLLDISRKSLKFSENFFKSHQLPFHLHKQNAFNMKFPNETFDCVWNSGVLEHYNDKQKLLMLKEMWRLVKKGGKLIVCVPNSFDIAFFIAKIILKIRKKWIFGFEDNINYFKLSKLIDCLGEINYKIYSYNPVVGMWLFPYGREITEILGFNKLRYHKRKFFFGHVIISVINKSKE